MFYKLIERKRNEWLNSPDCVVADLIAYIERRHKMRDAQIESIKTFLFLKIQCRNQPLWQIFASGILNTTDIDTLEVNRATRQVLESNPAALALWEYASISGENGKVNSPKIIEAIKNSPDTIDYVGVIKELLFNVTYPDYLFSIPMGAGKTYLMAALIYLNLYFASAEPDNPLFAHNFILLVPSGKKNSVVPSLRDIQNFDPLWILPDPVASQLKKLIKYEWLQEASSAAKSNTVKNPNARKICMHTVDPDLMGLVAVTNAEKVILNKVDNKFDVEKTVFSALSDEEKKEYEATLQANELREQIGKIPGLCILIDEVHHASEDQILRKVVNKWMEQSNFNSVLGFSGTPNMKSASKIRITDDLSIRCTQYANVVTYYPLINAIGKFLKIPTVRHADFDSAEIIDRGLREFFDRYKDTTYSNGTTAKIAIYAPSIAALEEEVYPEVCNICTEIGIDPAKAILKYHQGNTAYKVSEDAEFEFNTLDSPLSEKRVVLLVKIGSEGWNCKSLTGVILSQHSPSQQNMVLQISCRCLREVDDASRDTAIIWLNKSNADKLNQQLKKEHHITIAEFGGKLPEDVVPIRRHSRMKKLGLPAIDYYQLEINYSTVETEYVSDISGFLSRYQLPHTDASVIYTQGFTPGDETSESAIGLEIPESANFRLWLDRIVKESLGLLSIGELTEYETELRGLHQKLTVGEGGNTIYNPEIDQSRVRADVRCCFAVRRSFNTTEELKEKKADLLIENALTSPVGATVTDIYMPSQEKVASIIYQDENPNKTISEEIRRYLMANNLPLPEVDASIYDRTYHYLPYHLDSRLEKDYLESIIGYLKSIEGVEFYYNGDDTLTDFSIRCYAKRRKMWKFLGHYYPDFILLIRNADNSINKIVIVETKGEGFAGKFAERKHFMEDVFVKLNNEKFGRDRFDFLYIEDTLSKEARLQKTINKIKSFLLK